MSKDRPLDLSIPILIRPADKQELPDLARLECLAVKQRVEGGFIKDFENELRTWELFFESALSKTYVCELQENRSDIEDPILSSKTGLPLTGVMGTVCNSRRNYRLSNLYTIRSPVKTGSVLTETAIQEAMLLSVKNITLYPAYQKGEKWYSEHFFESMPDYNMILYAHNYQTALESVSIPYQNIKRELPARWPHHGY